MAAFEFGFPIPPGLLGNGRPLLFTRLVVCSRPRLLLRLDCKPVVGTECVKSVSTGPPGERWWLTFKHWARRERDKIEKNRCEQKMRTETTSHLKMLVASKCVASSARSFALSPLHWPSSSSAMITAVCILKEAGIPFLAYFLLDFNVSFNFSSSSPFGL